MARCIKSHGAKAKRAYFPVTLIAEGKWEDVQPVAELSVCAADHLYRLCNPGTSAKFTVCEPRALGRCSDFIALLYQTTSSAIVLSKHLKTARTTSVFTHLQ